MRFRIIQWIRISIWFRKNFHSKKIGSSEFSLFISLDIVFVWNHVSQWKFVTGKYCKDICPVGWTISSDRWTMAKRSWVVAWIKTGIQTLRISVMYGPDLSPVIRQWYMTHSLWVIDFWMLTSLFRLWTFSSKLFKQESCWSNKRQWSWTLSIFLSTHFCISILSLKKLFILPFLNV